MTDESSALAAILAALPAPTAESVPVASCASRFPLADLHASLPLPGFDNSVMDGYALHAAYWHDQFGTPRSHGCINLAPKDAARLFAFTKPEVPEGWHGASLALKGTVVWIHN